MIVRAHQKSVRIAPRKLRIVADAIRGKDLGRINDILSGLNKHGAQVINEVIRQAVANAVNNLGLPEEGLTLKTLMINEGMGYRRFKAGARGMAKPRVKRTSHILVEIESPATEAKKVAPTKASKEETKKKLEEKESAVAVPATSSVAPASVKTTATRATQKQTATKANRAGAKIAQVRKAGEK